MKLLPLFVAFAAATDCPNDACWEKTGDPAVCTLKAGDTCSKISCEATKMKVFFHNNLFDTTAQDQIETGLSPSVVASSDAAYNWVSDCNLGACGMESNIEGTNMVISQVFTFSGSSRARTDVEANKIEISQGLEITTGPVGMSLTFTCKYPIAITLTSAQFTVEDAPEIVGTKEQTGDLKAGFTFALDNNNQAVALGDRVTGTITWSVTGLWSSIKFLLNGCNISHLNDVSNNGAAFKVYIIKNKCYADNLFVFKESTPAAQAVRKFSYQTFLINEQSVGEQVIECDILMCKDDCDATPTCPDESGYGYTITGANA